MTIKNIFDNMAMLDRANEPCQLNTGNRNHARARVHRRIGNPAQRTRNEGKYDMVGNAAAKAYQRNARRIENKHSKQPTQHRGKRNEKIL